VKWITAALAFALIMLVLATVVTIILESAYKLLLTREKSFRLMMARMFDEMQVVLTKLSAAGPPPARSRNPSNNICGVT
jgi:hypothetical protein